MNKIIILIIFSIFYSINCEIYNSYELSNELRSNIYLNYYELFDLDYLLDFSYFSEISNLLGDIHDPTNRLTFLIIVEALNFSSVEQNLFMEDFVNRLISDVQNKKNYLIFLYSLNDKLLLNFAGSLTSIKSKDIDEFYSENVNKYEKYEDVLIQVLNDVKNKIFKNSLIVVIIILVLIVVIGAIIIIVICCYKRRTKGKVLSNQVQVVNPQQMDNNNINNLQNPTPYNQINNNYLGMNNDFNNYQNGNINLQQNNGYDNQQNIGYSSAKYQI